MQLHTQKEKLNIVARIGITKQVYDILKRIKRKSKFSMQKIVCNLVLESEKLDALPENDSQ